MSFTQQKIIPNMYFRDVGHSEKLLIQFKGMFPQLLRLGKLDSRINYPSALSM